MNRFVGLLVVFATIAIVGCGDNIGPIAGVASLQLQPTVLDVAADGGQAGLLVNGFTADGRPLSPAPRVLLFVRDTMIASLGSSNTARGSDLVIGRRPGRTYIVGVATDAAAIAQDSVLVRVGHLVHQ